MPIKERHYLSQEEVNSLPVGTQVMIYWFAGEKPYLYKIAKSQWGETYAASDTRVVKDLFVGWLDNVGNDKFHHRVWLTDAD